MTRKLNRQYIDEHRQSVHTLESFGAAVVDIAMQMVTEQIGDGEAEFVEINVPVRVETRTLRRSLGSLQDSRQLYVSNESGGDPIIEDPTTELTIGPITIDCITISYGVPPLAVAIHMPV